MATTQQQLDALIAARNAGVLRVDYPGGGGVTYVSPERLNAAIAQAQAELDRAAGTVPVRRVKVWGTKDY